VKQVTDARTERLERAREIVKAGAYLATAGAVLVESDSPGVAGYSIGHDGRCSCPDATVGYAAKNNLACKHRLVWEIVRSELLAVRPTTDLGPFKPEAPRRLPPREAWL
jgi:hypothetical protein